MQLTMCGTSSGASTAGPGAAILLEAAGTRLLLDCGNASGNSIVRALGPGTAPDAILFSHLHSDHVVGLPELLLRFALEARRWPPLFGPRGTIAYGGLAIGLAHHLHTNPEREPPPAPSITETRPGDERTLGDVRVRSVAVPHAAHLECLARRFDWDGGSLVYSGDTNDAAEIMTPLAMGADVLIHECYSERGSEAFLATLPERARPGAGRSLLQTHSRVETAARIARDAGVKVLVLTHLLEQEDPSHLAALAGETFEGRVLVAHSGLRIDA
jgi:ribonuclease BN (tRNA processing enzyme)